MSRKSWGFFSMALALVLSFAVPTISAPLARTAKSQRDDSKAVANLIREVRHQLVMLPYYSVFDNLAYSVDGDKVTLNGQTTRPTLRSDAENAVKSIEGVATVVNNIEVLPLSPMDDDIRRSVYRAIYGDVGLSRYALQAVPSIHIIVKNGNVTLEGMADNESDKNLAEMRARGVANVFGVKDNLTVANEKSK